jgi:hypothetical protein
MAGGEDEIPMTTIDHNDIAFDVEPTSPQFAGRSLKRVARQSVPQP